MAYKVIFPVQHNLKDYAIGSKIEFSRDEDEACDTLLGLGVIGEFETEKKSKAEAATDPADKTA
jgi:hypothetical protein